jgi:hypothetical protein
LASPPCSNSSLLGDRPGSNWRRLEQKYGGRNNTVDLDIDDAHSAIFNQQSEYQGQAHIFLLEADGRIAQSWVGQVSSEEGEAAVQGTAP